jgi:hypothetical protein
MRADPTLAKLNDVYEVTGHGPDGDLLHLVPKRTSPTIGPGLPAPASANAAPSP